MTTKEAITCIITRDKSGMLAILSAPEIFLCTRESIQDLIDRNNEARRELITDKHEITRLENEIDRLTQENLDQARELGEKAEPVEFGC